MEPARKSQRIANRRIAFKGSSLGDNPMTNIAAYSGKPVVWNKHFNDRYGCTPTNESYRVLGVGGEHGVACPMEARIAEPSANGNNYLCCTSRQPPAASHAESLWFLRSRKQIYQGAFRLRMPHELKRVVAWIMSPTNNSDVGSIPDDTPVNVNLPIARFLDLLKFAFLTNSSTQVVGRRQPGGIPGVDYAGFGIARLRNGVPAYDGK